MYTANFFEIVDLDMLKVSMKCKYTSWNTVADISTYQSLEY